MILVTGAAGFIGFHIARKLCEAGESVVGIDNMNSYYDPALKESRLKVLRSLKKFSFYKLDLCDYEGLRKIFDACRFDSICHMAAQAGVRYSLTDPFAYQKSNNEGFLNLIECARHAAVRNFVYASSSSVYGANTKLPFSESDRTDAPLSLYGATKRSNELVAHCYSRLFGLNTTALRFFTVYGPWGRPDMALFKFTKAILAGEPIDVYNNGKMRRNFTYIDDVVAGVLLALEHPAPCEIYNVGNSRAEELMDFIREIEKNLGKKAIVNYLPMQPGDVKETVADIARLRKLGYAPVTNIDRGIRNFIKWYREYYR
ncbi:MAG: SDR family NAD(P)-dependent oxidoreductase [Chitinispirillaceae bacterium]|jgi:UDP-glucuronate 4-epimerase